MTDQQQAILLIAHGSRRPAANQDLREVAACMQERFPQWIVEVSYLELAEPSIPQGAATCVQRGAREVRMLPYFLSAGNHVASDLAAFRDDFATAHPGVRFVLCPPLGLHPGLIDVLCARLEEGLGA